MTGGRRVGCVQPSSSGHAEKARKAVCKMRVVMIRETVGEQMDPATAMLERLKVGGTYEVSDRFGRWLVTQEKARTASGEKLPPPGPVDLKPATEVLQDMKGAKGK